MSEVEVWAKGRKMGVFVDADNDSLSVESECCGCGETWTKAEAFELYAALHRWFKP